MGSGLGASENQGILGVPLGRPYIKHVNVLEYRRSPLVVHSCIGNDTGMKGHKRLGFAV